MRDIEVGTGLFEQLPPAVRGRAHMLAVALVVVVGLLFVLAFLRPRPPAVIAPPARAADAVAGAAAPDVVLVHVAGAVRAPGVYELPVGARVGDAIAAAGGAKRTAQLAALNLAAEVLDGTQVLVPRKGIEPPVPAGMTATPSAPSVVSLNRADQTTLETIPGIGPVTAGAILAFRDENGGFTSLEQLMDVSGIGPATYESMLPYVSL